jgi:2-dehydropantoate 2-reductase
MHKNPEILLIGTGAVGAFYGGKLSQSGARVSVLCRSDYDVVRSNGIKIKSIYGDFHFSPAEVINKISNYSKRPDYIIVATKVLPEINIPEIIKEGVHPATSIVMLQNGIDIEEKIAQAFPENEIISALAFICATRLEYGLIEHKDYGRIAIGKYPYGISEKVTELANLFSQSGIPCQTHEDIITARWIKLVWNAPFNPISVLGGGVDTKTIMESENALNLVKSVMYEVKMIAERAGHIIPESIIEKNLQDTYSMTPYKTSMLNDFENKRPMEVEAILGNVMRIAEKYSLPIPCIRTLYSLLSLINNKLKR